MTFWLHSTVLATTLAATAAIGVASASLLTGPTDSPAHKGDRLAVTDTCQVADASNLTGCATPRYMTVEDRQPGLSVLTRVRAQ